MSKEEIKKTIEKQLQLLAERSANLIEDRDLPSYTKAMIELVDVLLDFD